MGATLAEKVTVFCPARELDLNTHPRIIVTDRLAETIDEEDLRTGFLTADRVRPILETRELD